MATAATIIARSLRLLGQIPSGGTPSTEEYADGLTAVNAMLDSWRNDRLMCYARRDESLTMVVAQSSYSIGPSGDLSTTRPVRIDDAYVVYGTLSDANIRILSDEEWDAIPDKTATSTWPNRINYRATMPTGTLYAYPVPNAASVLHLLTWTPLTVFTAITDTVSLPPGWEEALASNLAINLAPEYETEPRPSVIKLATDSKAGIKRINGKPIKAYTELPYLVGGTRHANIETDAP